MTLEGKNAIVTGGSRGIGKAIVEAFLVEGANVAYVSRTQAADHAALEATASKHGGSVVFRQADVGDDESITTAMKELHASMGSIDVLVNNAGITRDGLIFRMKSEDWDEVLRVNLSSAFYTCRTVSRIMIKQRTGSIINVTSIVGLIGNGGQVNYAASKAGMVGLTKSLAREVAGRSVRVNAVAPGFIETDMTGKLTEEQRETLVNQIPMARVGKPEEVASVCVFLAGDASSYMTGQVLPITGGMAM